MKTNEKQKLLKKAYAAMDRIEKNIHFIIAHIKENRKKSA